MNLPIPDPDIRLAVQAIQRGMVVGIPTDTVYGIGADPLNERAIARLYELKGRPSHKPVGLLAAGLEQASQVGHLQDEALTLAEAHWPGALTLIVVPKVVFPTWVGDTVAGTIGIRVPDHEVALRLLSETGPLAVTSANRSSGPETTDDNDARDVFGEAVGVYLKGSADGGMASTVVDASGSQLVVLREGPVEI